MANPILRYYLKEGEKEKKNNNIRVLKSYREYLLHMYLLGKLEKTKKKHIHYHRQYRKYFETEWRMDVITINVNNKPIISCVASISCISLVYINENPEFEKKFVIASIRSFFPPLFFPPRITAN